MHFVLQRFPSVLEQAYEDTCFCDCVVLVFLFLPLLVTLEFLAFYFPARHRVFSVLWIIILGRSETLLNATGVGGRNTEYFAFCTCH